MNKRLNLPSNSEIRKILKQNGKTLPSFPQVAAKLLEISKDETGSLTDLSKIVETDPGISVKVLEIVNSAMYGLGRKVTALSEAVVFLGLDEVKKIAIGMTVFEKLFKSGNAELFNRLLFWRHCLSVAVLSMELARATHYPDPEEAYIAGLLHDIGKIFLDIRGKNNYDDYIRELSTSTGPIIEKERSFMGMGHDDIGAFFCSQWKLPEKLVIAVKYHHQTFEHLSLKPEEKLLTSIVSLANFLCWTQGIGSFDIIRPPVLPPEVEKTINMEKIDVPHCIQTMNKEVENISKFYHFIFPSTNQLKENLLWTSLKLSKANTKYYFREKTPPVAATLSLDDPMPFDIGLDIGKPLSKAKSIKEVLDIVMYQVGCIFQPLNWSILLKDPKTSDMIFSVVVGANKKKLQGAKLPKGEGIAGYIMETGESVIIEDVSKDKRFSVRVDRYSGFTTRSVIGTPLKTDDKIFGVIELINRISDDPFTSQDLKILSSISEYAAIAIERSYYNQALTTLVTKDSLTDLKNRWSFERAIGNEKDVQKQYGTIFSMLIIEIEEFTKPNGKKGQSFKDTILKILSRVLKKVKRRGDDIFRYGEDTFIMLLPQTYADGAKKIKDKIIDEFSPAALKASSTPVLIHIFTHTISATDSDQLKNLIEKSLTPKSKVLKEDSIADLEENLQPLLEQESRKETAKVKTAKTFGKTVSLMGEFTRLKTGEEGYIKVERLSLLAIGFTVSKSHHIKVNDFLDIHIILDDINKSRVERRIVVRKIKNDFIDAEFYNPPPYAKKLGFYLMG